MAYVHPAATERRLSDADWIRLALRRHPWIWIGITAVALLTALAVNRWLPPLYEATATVIMEGSPDAVTSLSLASPLLGRSAVQNEIEEIQSRSIAQRVVEALPSRDRETLARLVPGDENRRVEWVCKSLRARAVKDAEVIRIRMRAPDAQLAASVVNTLTDVLQRQNISVRRLEADALYGFLDEQLSRITPQLQAAEDSLNQFRRKHQIVSLDKESETLLESMSGLEVRLAQARAERMALEARMASVLDETHRQEGELPRIVDVAEPRLNRMKQALVDLESQHATLSAQDYPLDHPKLVDLRREIQETRDRLTEEVTRIAGTQNVADPLARRNDLILERLNLELDLAAATAREKVLAEELTRGERQMAGVPVKELELVRLMRGQRLSEKLYLLLNEKREEARIAQAGEIGNLRVIDPAEIPERPVRPRPIWNLALALAVGLAVSAGISLWRETAQQHIESRDDVENSLHAEVMAEIPRIPSAWARRLRESPPAEEAGLAAITSSSNSRALLALEAFRGLAAQFTCLRTEGAPRSLLVTSALPGEGKTTTALYLSLLAAESGYRTLLIDCDFRRPSLHRMLAIPQTPGASEFLSGTTEPSVIRTTALHPKLSIATAGSHAANPLPLLASARMTEWIHRMGLAYDLVVLDSAPVLAAVDTTALARAVDMVLLVIRSGSTLRSDVQRACRVLHNVAPRMPGVVLNDVNWRRAYGYGHYYKKVYRRYTA